MSWLEDYDAENNSMSYSITRDVVNELCKKVVAMEEETLKHWFKMAFEAGKDHETIPFEDWYESFYNLLKQGAAHGD